MAADDLSPAELEGTLGHLLPGWRDHVVHHRFLPSVTINHAMPTTALGGLRGRPGPTVPGVEGLWVVGDWVGTTGHLASACFASGAEAANRILQMSPRSATAQAGTGHGAV